MGCCNSCDRTRFPSFSSSEESSLGVSEVSVLSSLRSPSAYACPPHCKRQVAGETFGQGEDGDFRPSV